MSIDLAVAIIMTLVAAATPILIAALGELVAERSGVMNIGIEGMMLLGAVVALVIIHHTGSYLLGVFGAAAIGAAVALAFGFLTVALATNQIVAGLALALFGVSLSVLIGRPYISQPIELLGPAFPAFMMEGAVSKAIFGHSIPVYFSLVAAAAVWWMLERTRLGTLLSATGEDHDAVHSIGYSVVTVRLSAVVFGGIMAGIAGSCFPLMLTPQWAEGLTSGRGWIALTLVVFAGWRPLRLIVGAYLFALVLTLELYAKAGGVRLIPSEVWAALPYAATLLALVIGLQRRSMSARPPECLGKPFYSQT